MVDEIRNSVINKDEAINILDRTIGFVENCDNKASIMLGIFGVVFTIIFSTDGIGEIIRILMMLFINRSFCNILFFLLWSVSLITLIIGTYNFISTLIAKIDCKDMASESLELNSKIYFGDIAKKNTYIQYKQGLLSLSKEEFLNDIISQIYINACIANNKFVKYNKGLRLSLVGYVTFISLWAIGSCLY